MLHPGQGAGVDDYLLLAELRLGAHGVLLPLGVGAAQLQGRGQVELAGVQRRGHLYEARRVAQRAHQLRHAAEQGPQRLRQLLRVARVEAVLALLLHDQHLHRLLVRGGAEVQIQLPMVVDTLPYQKQPLGISISFQLLLSKFLGDGTVDFVTRQSLQHWKTDLCAQGKCPLLRQPIVRTQQGQQRVLVSLREQREVERDSVLARHLDVAAVLHGDVADLVDGGDLGEGVGVALAHHHQTHGLVLARREADQPHLAHPAALVVAGGVTLAEVRREQLLSVLQEPVLQTHHISKTFGQLLNDIF